ELVHRDQWREHGSYVEKPPFPKPKTEVRIQEISRDEETGLVKLKIIPVHGDSVYYDVNGAKATSASAKVSDVKTFQTNDLRVSFLCEDSNGEFETGEAIEWQNRIILKSRVFQSGSDKMVELKAVPPATIRYTTDGSDPKNHGGVYDQPFALPAQTRVVLAVAEKDGVVSDLHRIDIDWSKTEGLALDLQKPALWKKSHITTTTQETYEFLERLKKFQAVPVAPRIAVAGQKDNWVELSAGQMVVFDTEKLENTIEHLRGLLTEGQVSLDVERLMFPSGQLLLDWVEAAKTQLDPEDVEQR
ncbi:MAG: chitobiase/beta-hexosaminidase C-terminal domain-containing protein, partial [bacterium]